jgi:hypothetical protein
MDITHEQLMNERQVALEPFGTRAGAGAAPTGAPVVR